MQLGRCSFFDLLWSADGVVGEEEVAFKYQQSTWLSKLVAAGCKPAQCCCLNFATPDVLMTCRGFWTAMGVSDVSFCSQQHSEGS